MVCITLCIKKLTDKNASVIKANCVAHILHNCGRYAGDKLRIDIENIVTKVRNHFSSSAKRVQELKEVFEFVDEEYTALYKNVPTRWLSLWPAVKLLHDSGQLSKAIFYFLEKSAVHQHFGNCSQIVRMEKTCPVNSRHTCCFCKIASKFFSTQCLKLRETRQLRVNFSS